MYTIPLEMQGIAYASISQTLAGRLNQAILKCQAGQEDATDRAITHEAILALRNKGVDGIILGCTEIPCSCKGRTTCPICSIRLKCWQKQRSGMRSANNDQFT